MPEQLISTTIDDKAVLTGLSKLHAQGKNLRPVMETIGNILLASTEDNFRAEGRFSTPNSWRGGSNKWTDLKPATVARRKKLGRSAHPILQVRGDLAASFSYQATDTSVTVGTNKTQAHALHYGFNGTVTVKSHTRKSTKGKTYTVKSFSRKMYLPPRPIIAVQQDDLEEINHALGNHLLRGTTS
jgi:phage gpG-like protein